MYPESKPIIFKCPKEYDFIELYFIHDLHIGNPCSDVHKYNKLKNHILSAPNRMVAWIGDLMEDALCGSKSDPLTQTMSPLEQREFVVGEFRALKNRTVSVSDGNHELNRATRFAGLYPLYDAACIAGIEDRYRSIYSVLDIAVGSGADGHESRQQRYIGFCCHKAKDLKSFGMVDFLEGFDFAAFGHDHDPRDHARSHLVYERNHKSVSVRSIETINCGSFLTYGGYGAANGYRPQSDKMYKLVLYGGRDSKIETVGFYPSQL